MRFPSSTYRLQLRADLGFDHARRLVPYLAALGIGDLYASPVLAAGTGSAHGYDVIDPTRLNSELGTQEAFYALLEELRLNGMGLLLDIVPNHMAMSSENAWWMDVLEHGQSSPYASFFDIDWRAPRMEGKVLVPVLGAPYGEVLERGELWLAVEQGGIFVRYVDHRFPLDPRSYRHLLEHRLDGLERELGPGHPARTRLRRLLGAIRNLPSRTEVDPEARGRATRDGSAIKRRLMELMDAHPEVRSFVERNVREWGGGPVSERRVELLDRLIGEQAYLLSYWRVAPEEIDYRRFFDIADLVALRQDVPEVFDATHGLVLDLVRQGKVTGLRVDHVDGLLDPTGYLRRLREGAGPRCFVLVEKVLAAGEDLFGGWPVAGTTGYEFANAVGDLFVDPGGAEALVRSWASFTGPETFHEIVRGAKRRVIEELFESEVRALAGRLQRLARRDRRARDLTRSDLTRALVEVAASFPVYRTYVRDRNVSPADRVRIAEAVRGATGELPAEAGPALDFLRRVLLIELPRRAPAERPRAWIAFAMRWQQFTGAVMAKGYEDTALYLYNPLVSRNEVGGDPGGPVVSPDVFHRRNRARLREWPGSLLATSTHDTKRSEDVRARIDVLSEMADEWSERVMQWSRWNRPKKTEVSGQLAPDPSDELLLYQTLVGAWPLSRREESGFVTRIQDYMQKAIREAKTHTGWIDHNPEYERAVASFVQAVLAPSNRRFRKDLTGVARTIAFHGAVNSLAGVILKVASPGVPDFYQGTESWSPTLVDPDNRRPPDHPRLARQLNALARQGAAGDEPGRLAAEMLATWQDGRVKLLVTRLALNHRKRHPDLFARGTYRSLAASGRWQDHVVAFARRRGRKWALAVVPRLTVRLAGTRIWPLGTEVWGSATLALPAGAPPAWTDVVTGQRVEVRSRRDRPVLLLAEVFAAFPVAFLAPAEETAR